MSRSKAALLLLICLCMAAAPALAQSDSLISAEMIETDTVNYKSTAVIAPGIYERTTQNGSKEFYPYTFSLRCEVNGAKFSKFYVGRKDEVKAGDVLAEFTLETDEVQLASLRMTLERTRESYQAGLADREKALEEMMETLSVTSDRLQRELLSLQIQRAQLAKEQYCYQQECQIDAQEREIARVEEENSRTQLISPFDGVVTDIEYKREGERVYFNEVLITLSRTDGMLLLVSSDSFRYGMEVEVLVGPVKKRQTLTGTVVASDNMLPENRRSGYAFVQLDPYDTESVKFVEPIIRCQSSYLENVFVIPRKAMVLDGGKHYVSKLAEDGTIQKRFVNAPLQGTSEAWVVQGLEAGETIIIE